MNKQRQDEIARAILKKRLREESEGSPVLVANMPHVLRQNALDAGIPHNEATEIAIILTDEIRAEEIAET